jgi:hypothetical protein
MDCVGDRRLLIAAKWPAFGIPAVARWIGWHSLFDE